MLRIQQKPVTQMNLESARARGDIPGFSLCPSKRLIVPSQLEFVQERVRKEKSMPSTIMLTGSFASELE